MAGDHDPQAPVALLFTDVEDSSALWESEPRMHAAIAAHDRLTRSLVRDAGGRVVKMLGDGAHAVFADPLAGVLAARALVAALGRPERDDGIPLALRCGLHVGIVETRDEDLFGPSVNRAARIAAAAHGGQILLSDAAATLVRDRLPKGCSLRDLGSVGLRGLAEAERLWQLVAPELTVEFPALSAQREVPNNLRRELTSFVGREDALRELETLASAHRLVTLVGPGGIGKTRLALQLAQDGLQRFADGVFIVELAPISGPDAVARAVADVLKLRDEPGRALPDTIGAHLAPRSLRLVLDNCEHVVEACAALAAELLRRAPALSIVATSREALRVPGEQLYPVSPLVLPSPGTGPAGEAVSLFIERARLIRPGFEPSCELRQAIGEICRVLDGLPLAIELAAARTASMSIADIRARLSDRFALLARGSRTAAPRQRTLAALVGWSYDLLEDEDRALFERLAVFAGGFDLAAAVAICGGSPVVDVEDALTELCAKSLLIAQPSTHGTRYAMLDTIGAFARQRFDASGEREAVREAHAAHYEVLARRLHPLLVGPEQAAVGGTLALEHDNLRAAFGHACEHGDADRALALASSLYRFWHVRGHLREGGEWLERALALPGSERSSWLGDAQYAAGVLAFYMGELDRAKRMLEASLAARERRGSTDGVAAALSSLANVLQNQGDVEGAVARQRQAREMFRAVGNRAGEGVCLVNLGSLELDKGEVDAARGHFEGALAAARETGHGALEELAESSLGEIDLLRGDVDAARGRFSRALAVAERIGDRTLLAAARASLGRADAEAGDVEAATARIADAIAQLDELGQKHEVVKALEHLAHAFAAGDRWMPAAGVLAAIDARRAELGLPLPPVMRPARAALQRAINERLPQREAGESRSGATASLAELLRLAKEDPSNTAAGTRAA